MLQNAFYTLFFRGVPFLDRVLEFVFEFLVQNAPDVYKALLAFIRPAEGWEKIGIGYVQVFLPAFDGFVVVCLEGFARFLFGHPGRSLVSQGAANLVPENPRVFVGGDFQVVLLDEYGVVADELDQRVVFEITLVPCELLGGRRLVGGILYGPVGDGGIGHLDE